MPVLLNVLGFGDSLVFEVLAGHLSASRSTRVRLTNSVRVYRESGQQLLEIPALTCGALGHSRAEDKQLEFI
jgi:hypothetical protein